MKHLYKGAFLKAPLLFHLTHHKNIDFFIAIHTLDENIKLQKYNDFKEFIMNKKLLFTLLISITLTSTTQIWTSYKPWGWAGPSDEEIAEYRAHYAQQSQASRDKEDEEHRIMTQGTEQEVKQFWNEHCRTLDAQKALERLERNNKSWSLLEGLTNIIIGNIENPEEEETSDLHTKQNLKKHKDDKTYCTVS